MSQTSISNKNQNTEERKKQPNTASAEENFSFNNYDSQVDENLSISISRENKQEDENDDHSSLVEQSPSLEEVEFNHSFEDAHDHSFDDHEEQVSRDQISQDISENQEMEHFLTESFSHFGQERVKNNLISPFQFQGIESNLSDEQEDNMFQVQKGVISDKEVLMEQNLGGSKKEMSCRNNLIFFKRNFKKQNKNVPRFLVRLAIKSLRKFRSEYSPDSYQKVVRYCQALEEWHCKLKKNVYLINHLRELFTNEKKFDRQTANINRKVFKNILKDEALKEMMNPRSQVRDNKLSYLIVTKVYSLRCMSQKLVVRNQTR